MVFETWLAIHRANANLHVVFTDDNTGRQTRHSVEFNESMQGGTAPGNYQHVKLALPKGFQDGTVHLSVEYKGYVLPEHENAFKPFLFVAHTKVTHATKKPGATPAGTDQRAP